MAELRDPRENAEAAQRFSAEGVRFIRVNHADPHGRCRSKELPIGRLAMATDGLGYCAASLVEGLDGDPLMGEAFPGGQGFPDLHAIGDLASARIAPWQPDTLWLLADLVETDGPPSPLCMRGVLRRVIERLAGRGLRAMVASEPEFYILRVGARRRGRALLAACGHGVHDRRARRSDRPRAPHPHRTRRVRTGRDDGAARVLAGPVRDQPRARRRAHAADNAFLLEEVVKELAAGEGLLATFMAKPLTDSEGSSHHVHASLWRGDENAFDDGGADERRGARLRGRADRSRARA